MYKLYFCKEEVLQTERVIWSIIIDLNPVRFSPGPRDGTKLICGTKPIRYITLHFRDRRGARSFVPLQLSRRNHPVLVCEQRPYPVWFSCRRESYPVQLCRQIPKRTQVGTEHNEWTKFNYGVVDCASGRNEGPNRSLLLQAPAGGGGVLPMMAYAGRLRP